jgi:topoisomerase-4 subunit A
MGEGETMLAAIAVRQGGTQKIVGHGRGGKRSEQTVSWNALQDYVLHRARKGVLVPLKFKVESLVVDE